MWKRMTVGLLLVFLCGCIRTKDELTINADGSGKVQIETQSSIPPELSEGMGMQAGLGGTGGGIIYIYPPLSEAEARKFFPGKDFNVTAKQQKADNGDVTTVIEADFKNINVLLASPYGRAHQLSVKIADGSLTLRGVTGMEATARFAEMKDDTGMGLATMPGLADLQKKKGEMRAEFRVTLPNAITSANGARDGKTASWIVERAKCKDAEDFARQLSTVSEATCPADGLKMAPVTPLRMGLQPFAKLAAGAANAGAAVDTNKITDAAKFVPYGLSITRSLDLSGEGSAQENVAQLVGAVTLPHEFAPQKWGNVQLDEVVDAKGNDLKPSDSDEARNFMMRARFSGVGNGADEESATNNVLQHIVVIGFRPPDWKVNEIARIKGSVNLQYFGGSQVVKLTNAIPANWIGDASKMMGGGGLDSSEKPLNSATLAGIGLFMSVQMGMAQSGMTMLEMQVKGKQAALTDAQVFDADGKPWPTFLQQQDYGNGDANMCQILVAGKPQPPLSLALLASGSGSTVEVPILLEHVVLTK
ncbi:MAG: hypothetical protein WBW41_06965 [Verrucomicrobiia bacterium]